MMAFTIGKLRSRRVGLIPVIAMAVLIGFLAFFNDGGPVYNPPYAAFFLTLIFVLIIDIAVAFVSARAYMGSGSLNVVLLGAAVLITGLSTMLAIWMLDPNVPPSLTSDQAITLNNISILIGAFLLLLSAITTSAGTGTFEPRQRRTILVTTYTLTLLVFVLVSVLAFFNQFPVFLTSTGPTELRIAALTATVVLVLASGLWFGVRYQQNRSSILYWYSLALALYGLDLIAAVFIVHLGDPLTWATRMALYLSSIYFLLALQSRESKIEVDAGLSERWADAFRNDREKLASLFAKLTNGVLYGKLVMDADGRPVDLIYLDMNDAYEPIIGAKKEKFLGRRATEAVPGLIEQVPNWIVPYAQAVMKGETVSYERYWPYTGKWYYITIYSPEKGHFVAINEDITERKKIEDELERTKARLEAIINQMPVGIMVADAGSGAIIFSNPEAEKMYDLGFQLMEIKGFADYPRMARHHLDGTEYKTEEYPIVRSLHGEVIKSELAEIVRPGRPLVYISGSSAPVIDSAGQIVASVALSIDVTEQIGAQRERDGLLDEMERYSEILHRSNEELQQFAYLASHDLQEPLRMVISYLSLLDRKYKGVLEPTAQEYIDHAVQGGARMRQLIDDLLEYSRIESRAKVIAPVDMKQVLENTIKVLKVPIEENRADIYVGPMPTIMADELQMQQVMQNLISNAVKFHGPERPMVHISAMEAMKEWTFFVKDNGIGLNQQYSDRIFQMFQRLHNQSQYAGTGVGLAIAKKIVERHGGRIWVESQEGEGATFFFTIPKNG